MRANAVVRVLTVIAILAASCPVLSAGTQGLAAKPAPPIGVRGESEGRPEVSGEVSDIRSLLEKRGVSFALTYRGEIFHSVRLQPEGVTRYRGLIEAALNLDTDKSGLWSGGTFFVRGQDGRGQVINVTPGGIGQPISNIDASDFTQVSQYGLTQKVFGGTLTVDVGKRDVNAIFCANRLATHFIDPVFTLIPTVPMPTFPAPALGAAVFAEPLKTLTIGLGTYDGTPKIGGLGFETAFENKGQYFSVAEAHWTPAFGPGGLLHGSHRLGLWYLSGPFQSTGAGANPAIFHGNYGFYALLNQLVYKRSKERTSPEIDAFVQLGWAPSDRNAQTSYVSLGAAYKRFGNGRHTVGIAVGHTWMIARDPAGHKTQMTNVELFYRIEARAWLTVQPEVQYFDNADVAGRQGFAPGVRWIAHF